MAQRAVHVKKRINVLMQVWDIVLKEWSARGGIDRERVVSILKSVYERERLRPLKGASTPPDIYDKEMASLYVVGKHGMGLDEEYPSLFDSVFSHEIRYEKAIEILLSKDPREARALVEALLGGNPSSNTIARMFRLRLTEAYFGFSDKESLIKLLRAFSEAFPEKRSLVSKYARFLIAFTVADAISRGEVRNRITKEALKQALALEMKWLDKHIPDDRYIGLIAEEVFQVPRRILKSILSWDRGPEKAPRRGDRQVDS